MREVGAEIMFALKELQNMLAYIRRAGRIVDVSAKRLPRTFTFPYGLVGKKYAYHG